MLRWYHPPLFTPALRLPDHIFSLPTKAGERENVVLNVSIRDETCAMGKNGVQTKLFSFQAPSVRTMQKNREGDQRQANISHGNIVIAKRKCNAKQMEGKNECSWSGKKAKQKQAAKEDFK